MSEQSNNIADNGPPTIQHVVASGENRKIVESIRIALEATFNSQRPMPHVLLCGGAGTGKSMYADLICKELAVPPVTVLGQTLRTAAEVNAVLVGMTDIQSVLVIDEIHTLGTDGQHALLRAMENGEVFLEPNGRRSKPVTIKLNRLTVIGASTDEYELIDPLRDRFRLTLRLSPYSAQDLEALLRQRCRQIGWEFEDDVLHLIAVRSRGNPRWSLRIAESIWRTATAEGATVVRADHAFKTFELEGIDVHGLGKIERDYLAVLADADVPVRLNIIATRLGVPTQTLTKTVEPYLVRMSLITKNEGGRVLTPSGIEHVRSQVDASEEEAS